MGFVKIIKNKAYFKRFQVKFKRRRECKTDYYARQRLILQDKNKYKMPKYRFVVRFTNRDIVCQIFSADMDHDVCIASAYAHELSRYGVKVGLTNWSAAYCTGLLLARRVNAKFKLDYTGPVRADTDNADWNENYDEGYFEMDHKKGEKRPFRALLDVGLARTTTGSRLFGALKGACDGGLDIPHTNKRFPGTKKDDEGEIVEDIDTQRKYIFGGHVAEYMEKLQEEDKQNKTQNYKRQFNAYIAAGVTADDLEDMYKNAHAGIRADPNKKRDASEKGRFQTWKSGEKRDTTKKSYKVAKTSREDKADKVRTALLAIGKKSVSDMEWKESDAAVEEAGDQKVAAVAEEEESDDDDLL